MTYWTKMVLGAVLPLLLAMSAAQAGTIEVAPVMAELLPGSSSTTLIVTNHNPVRTSIQVRGYSWSQTDTTDPLARTDNLIVSPPIFQLDPGQSQTIRLLVRQPPARGEATYRLLVDELPGGPGSGTVQFALRLSLPVFAEAEAQPGPPQLSWRIAPLGPGMAELRVRNDGDHHDRLSDLALQIPGVGTVKPTGLPNPYVLAGAERSWRIALGSGARLSGRIVQLTGRDMTGSIHVPVPVGP